MATRLSCPACGAKVGSLQRLNDHLDRVHSNGDKDLAPRPLIVDKTERFIRHRDAQVGSTTIHRTKLDLRLLKLLNGLQRISETNDSAFWNWKQVSASRAFEESIVSWEDESVFDRCRFCGQRFSFFLRKHHCRVCGLVTCGDVERECSLEVPAVMLAEKMSASGTEFAELKKVKTEFPVRICTECRSTLFSRRNYLADVQRDPPRLIRLLQQLQKLQSDVISVIPQFQELLATAASGSLPNNDVERIRQSRHQILRLFSKYDSLTKKIRETPVETETENRLRSQILVKAAGFLETTMLPLQSLPQTLRYNEPKVQNKADAAKLQNTLVVMEEQRFLLERQVAEAKENRQFDVLAPMEMSLAELTAEVSRITEQLGRLAPSA